MPDAPACAFCSATAAPARLEIPGLPMLAVQLCEDCAGVAASVGGRAMQALERHGIGAEHIEKAGQIGAAANMLAGFVSRRLG